MEIPGELMHGPRLVLADDGYDDDQRSPDERSGGPLDLDVVLGRRGTARLYDRGRSRPLGPRILPPGGGYVAESVGAPRPGEAFRPTRDLAAKRASYYGTAPDATGRPTGASPADPAAWAVPATPAIPGQRRYRDGDRVRHRAFGEGRVVTSKLTRDDEEVTVAFPDHGVKRLLASLANLEVSGS